MYRCVKDKETGEVYGWGKVLDYIGVEWEDRYVERPVRGLGEKADELF